MAEVDRKPVGDIPAKRKRRPRGRPKGLRINVLPSVQLLGIVTQLGLSGRILTFRDLQHELEVQRGIRIGLGTLERFASGVEPVRASVRHALGLPPIEKVTVCQACGVVHIKKCPKSAGLRKPRRNVRRIVMAALGLPWE